MNITHAVITAAGRDQRHLHTQRLNDRDGAPATVLALIIAHARRAGANQIGVVIAPGDESRYRDALPDASDVYFLPQDNPRGYGDAIYRARDFVGDRAFLHLIGDHIYVNDDSESDCAWQIVEIAHAHEAAVSGVQATRESLLPYFGAVGGQRVAGAPGLYRVESVAEKPTPTFAEQNLLVPGLRAGQYLCFFGIHVLTPTIWEILALHLERADAGANVGLSPALSELAARETLLAAEARGRRYALDAKYGLLTAGLALALAGRDRDEVLTTLTDLLAQRAMGRGTG